MDRASSILRRFAAFILPILVFGPFSGCSSGSASPDYNAAIAEAKAAFADAIRECHPSAITLALADEKGVIWTESQGDADRAARKGVDSETMFGIGSVSKMFATIAVMQLVEKEGVELAEPLTAHLKQFSMVSPEYRNMTVRMLLNHSAGLPGGDMRNSLSELPFTGYAAGVMDSLKYQRLKHTPGYLNVYSNDGFTMVENLVKAVTGLSYPEYVRQNILAPLGMTGSRYMDDHLPDGSYAKTYTDDIGSSGGSGMNGQGMVHPYMSLNTYATGGLYSSAADMAKLMVMLINKGANGMKPILSPASIAAMSADQTVGTFNPSPSDQLRYGLGWDTVAQPGLKAVGISGWAKGGAIDGPFGTMFRSVMIIAPEAKLGVAVMMASNKTSSDAVTKVAERVLLQALVARGVLTRVPVPLAQNPLPVVTPPPVEQDSFSGPYAASGTLYRLNFAANGLLTVDSYVDNAWKPKYQGFKKRSDGWYAADGDSITALRLLDASGRRYFEIRNLGGAGHYTNAILMAQQLAVRDALSPAWQARRAVCWLAVNEDWLAGFLDLPFRRALTLDAVDSRIDNEPDRLTGYLFAGMQALRDMEPQADDRLDGMFLQIPQAMGRDLLDAAIERREESDWLRVGSTLFRPLPGVPSVPAGSTSVTIGSEGLAEWRKLPVSGSISISNPRAWRLYDSNFTQTASGAGSGSTVLPRTGDAAYLLLFGAPGTAIGLRY